MTDILVTSPFQPFTLPTQFKAVFNGYIYCGTVDAVDPSVSQVQVYMVNESGDKVPVAQPLRTNAGGFLVYNGQPAKFVTGSNHSLLVQDSFQVQVWYAPDVSKADPDAIATMLGAQTREALRRSYAEAGFNLVSGSFGAGGILTSVLDVLLDESSGIAYSSNGPFNVVVSEGTDPIAGGFIDRSDSLLKDCLPVYASRYGFDGSTTNFKSLFKQFMAEPKNKIIDVDIYTSGVAVVADNTAVIRHKGAVIYALGDVTTDPDANANNQGQVLEAGNNTTFTGVKIDGQGFKGNGIFNGAKTNVTIQLCDLSNGTGQAILDVGGINSKYHDNDLYKCLHGVQMWLTNGARVRGNHVYQVTGGIWTAVGRDVLAWGNIIHDCGDVGLDWEGGQNCHSFNNEIWACAHGELAIFQTGSELVGEGIVMGNLSHNNNKIKRFATRLNEAGAIVQNDLDDVGAITIYGLDAALAGPIEIKNNAINVESATGDHPLSLRSIVVRATANANTEYLDISGNDIYTNYSLAFTMGRINKLRFAYNLIVFKQTNPVGSNEIKNTDNGIIHCNEFRVLDNLTPPSTPLVLLSTDSAVSGRLRLSENKFSNCGPTPIMIDQALSNRKVNVSRNSLFESSTSTELTGSTTGGIEVINGSVLYNDQDLTFAIGDNEVFNLASKSALGRSQSSAIGHVSMQMGGVGPMYRVAVQTRIGTVEMNALDNGGAINTGIFPNPARYVTFGAATIQPQDTDPGAANSAVLHLTMNSKY